MLKVWPGKSILSKKRPKNTKNNGQLFGYADFGGCWTPTSVHCMVGGTAAVVIGLLDSPTVRWHTHLLRTVGALHGGQRSISPQV